MSDQEFSIDIKTTGDPKGAKEVEQKLLDLAAAREKAGRESVAAGDDEAKASRRLVHELNKVEEKYKDVVAAQKHGFDGQLDAQRTAAINEQTEAIDEQTEALKENKQAAQDVADAEPEWTRAWHNQSKATDDAGEGLVLFGGKLDTTKLKQIAAASGHAQSAAALESFASTVSTKGALIAAELAAIAVAAKWSYDAVSQTISGYEEAIADAKNKGIDIGPEFEAEINAWKTTLSPIQGIIEGIATGWNTVKEAVANPVDFFGGLSEFREWAKEHAEAIEFTKNAQKEFLEKRYETRSTNLTEMYQREADELERQLDLTQQIQRTRNQLDDITVQRARNQIRIAQQDGGDVGAAEANALLVELQTTLRKTTDGIAQAKIQAEQAASDAAVTGQQYSLAVQSGRSREELEELKRKWDAADEAVRAADTVVSDIQKAAKEKQLLAAENAEITIRDLQEKYKGAITASAENAFSAVQSKIQEVADTAQGQTAAQVAQVKTQVVADQKATADAAKSIATESAKAQQIAATDTTKAISDLGASFMGSLAKITSVVEGLKRDASAQQQQINQLQAR